MSDPLFVNGFADVIDLIARRGEMATTATPSLAGKPYFPSSGSEDIAFEDEWCRPTSSGRSAIVWVAA